MIETRCKDKVILNLWHPIAAADETARGKVADTMLLEERVSFALDGVGNAAAWRSRPELRAGDPRPRGSGRATRGASSSPTRSARSKRRGLASRSSPRSRPRSRSCSGASG